MRASSLKTVFLFAAIACFTWSCTKMEEFSAIPSISFKKFSKSTVNGIDDSVRVAISFTDGDGDIGLKDEETSAPYDVNLFITYFELQDGKYIPIPEKSTYRIPYLVPSGKNKALRGDIAVKLSLPPGRDAYNTDTVHFEIYMMDRALNKSNIITTPDLILTLR